MEPIYTCAGAPDGEVARRLSEMETKSRRSQIVSAIAGIALLFLLVSGQSRKEAETPVPDRVVAREFVLRDAAGNERAKLFVDEDGDTSLRLRGAKDGVEIRAYVSANGERAEVSLLNRKVRTGGLRLLLQNGGKESAVEFLGQKNESQAVISCSEQERVLSFKGEGKSTVGVRAGQGYASFLAADAEGKSRLDLTWVRTAQGEQAQLQFLGKNGENRAKLWAQHDKVAMELAANTANLIVLDKDGRNCGAFGHEGQITQLRIDDGTNDLLLGSLGDATAGIRIGSAKHKKPFVAVLGNGLGGKQAGGFMAFDNQGNVIWRAPN